MKRLLRLLLSAAVRISDVASVAFFQWFGRLPQGTCVILYYHGVSSLQRARFSQQMDEVLRLSTPLPAGTCDLLSAGRHHCVLTFDDGFISVVKNALPELELRGIPFTIFVPTGSLGSRPRWIKDTAHPAHNEVVLASEQIVALKNCKLATVGSHTVSHPNLSLLSETQARYELASSKASLEELLGQPVTLFSFPHGKYNARLVRMAREVGYDRVFTIEPSFGLQTSREFLTGRVAVGPEDWPIEFRLKLMGAYRWSAKLHRCLSRSTTESVYSPDTL